MIQRLRVRLQHQPTRQFANGSLIWSTNINLARHRQKLNRVSCAASDSADCGKHASLPSQQCSQSSFVSSGHHAVAFEAATRPAAPHASVQAAPARGLRSIRISQFPLTPSRDGELRVDSSARPRTVRMGTTQSTPAAQQQSSLPVNSKVVSTLGPE